PAQEAKTTGRRRRTCDPRQAARRSAQRISGGGARSRCSFDSSPKDRNWPNYYPRHEAAKFATTEGVSIHFETLHGWPSHSSVLLLRPALTFLRSPALGKVFSKYQCKLRAVER